MTKQLLTCRIQARIRQGITKGLADPYKPYRLCYVHPLACLFVTLGHVWVQKTKLFIFIGLSQNNTEPTETIINPIVVLVVVVVFISLWFVRESSTWNESVKQTAQHDNRTLYTLHSALTTRPTIRKWQESYINSNVKYLDLITSLWVWHAVWRSSTSCTVTPTTTRLTVQSTVSLVTLTLEAITPVIQSLAASSAVQVREFRIYLQDSVARYCVYYLWHFNTNQHR